MEQTNTLFPVFLKLEQLRLLIVGGGFIGLEKLQAVINNSPATDITLVGITISNDIKALAALYSNIKLLEKPYETSDLQNKDLVIAAVNDISLATTITADTKQHGILINAADKPDLCDFYLGSIVKKGNLKIAISTNGKSPTIAKRVKEMMNEILPEQIDELLNNMQAYRAQLKGDFENKVNTLNEVTKTLIVKQLDIPEGRPPFKLWQDVVKWLLLAFFFMLLGHAVFLYVPLGTVVTGIKVIPQYIDTPSFLLMVLAGFMAQMADGSLGMGYGTISTVFLLAIGVNPAIVSSRVHSARVFSSGVSGYSHHRFGNINKKLFSALVIPGIIGAISGAALAVFAKEYAIYVRIPLSFYTIYLGYYIIRKAFAKKIVQDSVKNAGWLACAGGFLDAFAGGGWGALVTSTLIAKRKTTRYVIGSVCLAEFFVVFASATTFFILLKHIPILDVLGLILGGVVAAPIAARLVGKIPVKKVLIGVGILVILTSTNTLVKSAMTVLQIIHKK
ncbi:TSUP family transporter [Parasediminibacterium sp. JCM 36343]|uniref:TSUP family transporter n=1 Tax=Parasediminibacterium sp. JCM 36343 TaxID=3374279 RepID=UPI00397D3B78